MLVAVDGQKRPKVKIAPPAAGIVPQNLRAVSTLLSFNCQGKGVKL